MPAIVFTRQQTAIDPATRRQTVTPVTIPGQGVFVRGDPKRYERLQLRQGEARTIKWAPDVYGQTPDPAPGDRCAFSDKSWDVRDVDPINPDGVALVFASIVVVGA
jgi:hypothetical protein